MASTTQDSIAKDALDYIEQLATDLNRMSIQRELIESNIKKTQEAIDRASKALEGKFAPRC